MEIQFTVTSVNGKESPLQWYAKKLKEFARDKYGLDVHVEIEVKQPNNDDK